MTKAAEILGENAGDEFVDKLMKEITNSPTEQFVFATIADKLLGGMIVFRISPNVAVKFLEELAKLLKKSPGYKGE